MADFTFFRLAGILETLEFSYGGHIADQRVLVTTRMRVFGSPFEKGPMLETGSSPRAAAATRHAELARQILSE